jgi:hypothetical protein
MPAEMFPADNADFADKKLCAICTICGKIFSVINDYPIAKEFPT